MGWVHRALAVAAALAVLVLGVRAADRRPAAHAPFEPQRCGACHADDGVGARPADHDAPRWLERHGHRAPVARCGGCHPVETCRACHAVRPPSHTEGFVRPWTAADAETHAAAARVPGLCATCHGALVKDCAACHLIDELRALETAGGGPWPTRLGAAR
jgi:hypothetical protein